MTVSRSIPADQADRDRFIGEYSKNISVIAPAGVGKTDAIVKRIVGLAARPDAADRFPRLVVVTYSVRAAQEMQRRAALGMREAKGVSLQVHRAFQQTFFGTIHSYCVRILERYGHYLGLPSSIELLLEEDEMWNRFLVHGLRQSFVHQPQLDELFHFYAPDKLYALGQELSPGPVPEVDPVPDLNLGPLIDFNDSTLAASTRKTLARVQAELSHWNKAWARGDRYHPLPQAPGTQAAPRFMELWVDTFTPLQEWMREACLAFGRGVANAYEDFRLREGVMTYDDQVRMALRVLQHPEVQREIAEERLSVLLDEAQDTDFRQFEVLLRVAGLQQEAKQSEEQSYGIVGDFQQAIYAPRSDLGKYRAVHEQVSAEPRGATTRFRVTFRCDRAIIDFVNQAFPAVLNKENGQSEFSVLTARDQAGEGQVVRWVCPDEPRRERGEKVAVGELAEHEARFLAGQIHKVGHAGLGARDWANVAVLCPRKDWLIAISRELARLEVPIQFHSSRETRQDRSAAAWLTSLVWIAAHPEDSFEIVGVLREIFGVSDHDMALFTQGEGGRLRLNRVAQNIESPVNDALEVLRQACAGLHQLSLHQAVSRLCEAVHLRPRLREVAGGEEKVDRELDALLAFTFERGARGATLMELAHELRASLKQQPDEEEEIRNAVQLMTSHKAKGLEWDAVIVPFFFRAIESKAPPYPRLILHPSGIESIYRDRHDYNANAKDEVERRESQQLQRLLYVTCTRPRKTLVLVDDEKLFSTRSRNVGWPSGALLGFQDMGSQAAIWKALPEALLPASSIDEPAISPIEPISVPDHSLDLEAARANAAAIPKRVTPHSLALAVHQVNESEPERALEEVEEKKSNLKTPGILYGTWWHEFIESLPWQAPRAIWQTKFDAAVESSPQPDRSRQEWEIFCASELGRWLAEPGRIIHTEWPFLWRESDARCVEGIIDLAVFTPADSTWRVIDWKTNLIGTAGGRGMVETYRGQIEAYLKIIREALEMPVEGGLYLTATGEWVKVD